MASIIEKNIQAPAARVRSVVRRKRNVRDILDPFDGLAKWSSYLIANHGANFQVEDETYSLARYLFLGPSGGAEPIRLGLFATIHGDEPEGAYALIDFIRRLEASPSLAQGYALFIYPLCNPSGYEDATRCSRRGRDLNREFWNRSSEPEVQLLEQELYLQNFHGILSLHSDDTSTGLYGFVKGATLTTHIMEPALKAASVVLPVNREGIIDGFNAREGIIRDGYQGILTSPPKIRPKPFEIVLETPQTAPLHQQVDASSLALLSILNEYRRVISYGANL
ncbi:MAG TPA: succinylglutamate desuccinylase/aspartoacylase family protein [Candidatus Limnocylindria bacterium]|jgi:hypothetical protein|nr:succinylglutamate desuccinylase/aspartoacylase family protein [Candidatus Limnocylindria bacterium]